MSILQRDPADQVQILDDDGQVREDATVPDLSDDRLVEMYRQLKLGRHFDERAVSLQRQGRMGTYPPMAGQEAAQIGSAHALEDEDWVYPSYREHMVAYQQGWPLEGILLYWMGSEEGKAPPEDVNVFTLSVPIATQLPTRQGRPGPRSCRARKTPTSVTLVTAQPRRVISTRG
jgi:Pyruvate/2-oxoglutarate dehydrogenase complex, dehydrogenase (E1) component, eukaryotic type, alpha subunit